MKTHSNLLVVNKAQDTTTFISDMIYDHELPADTLQLKSPLLSKTY